MMPEEVQRLRVENAALHEEVAALRLDNEQLRRERHANVKLRQAVVQIKVRRGCCLCQCQWRSALIHINGAIRQQEACARLELPDNATLDVMQSPKTSTGSSTVRPTPLNPPLRALADSRPASRGPPESTTMFSSHRSRLATPPPPSKSSSASPATALGAPFELSSPNGLQSLPTSARKYASLPRGAHTRIKSGDYGSPMRVPISGAVARASSLLTSPGVLSEYEGNSSTLHYEERPSASGSGGTGSGNPKWRFHFAKAPMSARAASEPVPLKRLAQVLQLDEDDVRH
jgi:hypothetical protein